MSQLKTTRERVDQVKEEMKKYKTLMESSTEQNIGTFIKYGVVLAEVGFIILTASISEIP